MDKLEQWRQTGGTLRVVELTDDLAVVDLCACTGELMERWSTREPDLIRHLQTGGTGRESASCPGERPRPHG